MRAPGRSFRNEFESSYPRGAAMGVVVLAAPFRVEGYFVGNEPEVDIMVPLPWDAEDEWVVAKLCDEEEGVFHMVSDLKLGADKVGTHTGGYRSSIDDLHGAGSLQGDQREMVAASEVFIHKGEASSTIVEKGIGRNRRLGRITGKLASND